MAGPLLGTLLISIVFWLVGYFGQKYDDESEQRVRVPAWFRFLFGAPLGKEQMTIQGMAYQLVAYLSAIGAWVCEVVVPDPRDRIAIVVMWMIFLWFCAAIWIRVIAPRIWKKDRSH